MIDLTIKQLVAGKQALFRVCEDPEFDDVRAIVNAVFPDELEKHQELLQAIKDRQAIEKLHSAAADELERVRNMMKLVTGRDDWQRMTTEECEAHAAAPAKLLALQSWERSVLAEVGDALHHSTPWKQMVDHYKHRAEHLAAKLLEAQSCQVSTTRALQAAERIAITAHECWDKDQDYKVGKLLLAMIRNDLKYSDDCTIFRMGIQAIDGQPAPNPIEISRELFDAATGALAPKSGEQSNG